MYRKIIVGYNDSDGSQDALALASQVAQSTGAQLILTCVAQRRAELPLQDPQRWNTRAGYAAAAVPLITSRITRLGCAASASTKPRW